MPQPSTRLETTNSSALDPPSESGDRLLLERGRLGLRLILGGIAGVFVRFPGHGLRCEIEIPIPPPS